MKNILKYAVITVGLAAIFTSGTPVYAADATTSSTTTATFTATPGTLTLDAVPNLNFGQLSVAQLISGDVTQTLQDGDVADASGDGTSDLKVQVTDTRGVNSGWQLSAAVGTFTLKGDSAVKLNVKRLTISGVTTSTTGDKANAFNTASSLTDGPTVWCADETNAGTGTNTAQINAGGASVVIGQTSQIRSGVYDAPVTWELTAGPQN